MPPIYPDSPGVDDPGPGVRLALDVGTVRIGVARSNREATLAMPVETVARATRRKGPDGEDIDRILDIVELYDAVEVVVGLPRTLSGDGSASAKHAAEIARRVRRRLKRLKPAEKAVPVRLADERLTTVVATQALHASGLSARTSRAVVDQAAAVEILQSWLDGRNNALARAAADASSTAAEESLVAPSSDPA
ncbi:Holliday junction resolvase RuvX [Corynebacterium sp. 13CS0277]|uniref:Holliday junction resolvase RuvX n=1 Tax=Corynebacterium sp. 13CS0277 TaxID=2071994 RepID=UPI000D043DEB|nr:Holliday junction resolvase RuvX [Corynebacterium sp. 13CS0277]PRQ11961.1 Holliday junction resolvase RuvX [Corynebacterium sp. 13CS0277]